jgi:hypothetical protein
LLRLVLLNGEVLAVAAAETILVAVKAGRAGVVCTVAEVVVTVGEFI